MNITELTNWLRQQQPIIEKIILEAAGQYSDDHSKKENFGYDLSCAQDEGYNLMNGTDLCYDQYTTLFSYSLRYQGRRINVFLSNFTDKIHEACDSNQPIDIFDPGGGIGRVQFCFGPSRFGAEWLSKLLPEAHHKHQKKRWVLKVFNRNIAIGGTVPVKGSTRAQIDLLIDRADRTINICEMKFYNGEFVIDKSYASELEPKLTVFAGRKKTASHFF